MTAVCARDGCWRPSRARGLCIRHWNAYRRSDQFTYAPGTDPTGNWLVCICVTPQPTPTDMCATCSRVIAELVRARRRARP